MEIKWEKMDYIAFILLGMLTIFYGNKQLQQLVAGLYIALAIWYVYTIILKLVLMQAAYLWYVFA